MVWRLSPVDQLSGEAKYYIFAKGTYKVGRKGCDVTITKDKGVSRVHCEIFVDAMQSFDSTEKGSSNIPSRVRIRDCSKYGTFVSRNGSSKEKVYDKETELKDGDVITFGTGDAAAYRFCFVPFVFYFCDSSASQATGSVHDKASEIGAYVKEKWDEKCTHVIVDKFTSLNEDLVDAIVSKRPFVSHHWLECLMESRIRSELPSYTSYVPTFAVDGTSVALADAKAREICLKEYTFVLDAEHMYKFGNKLKLLLASSGAKVISTEACNKSQELEGGEVNRFVYVMPSGSVDGAQSRVSLSKISDINLVRSALAGYLDQSFIIAPSIVVSSSCSTDEIIVADSDAETELATSDQSAAKSRDYALHSSGTGQPAKHVDQNNKTTVIKVKDDEPVCDEIKRVASTDHAATVSQSFHITNFVDGGNKASTRVEKDDESEVRGSDILYSQRLVVRDIHPPPGIKSVTDSNLVNFKRFRKTEVQSGNSFYNLIPFAKNPYKESDNDNKDVMDSLKEENKRKEMEALAEDLFNSEEGRKRVTGSIHGILTRR